MKFLLAACAAAAFATPCLAADPSAQAGIAAQAPVMLRMYSEQVLLGMQLSTRKSWREGKVSAAGKDCLDALRSERFDTLMAEFMARALTPAEIRAGEEFFASELGRKLTRLGVVQMYAELGTPLSEPRPVLSQAETRTYAEFSRTSAGHKIIVQDVVASKDNQPRMNVLIAEILRECNALPPRK